MLKRNLRDVFFRFDESMKKFSFFLLYCGGLLYKESRTEKKPPLFKRIGYYLKGYTTESWRLYHQSCDPQPPELYVSDYQRYNKAPRVNDKYGILLADKNLFTDFMSPYRSYLPETYAEVHGGRIVPSERSSHPAGNTGELAELLESGHALALKSSSGYGGLGFHVCMKVGETLTIDNEPADTARLDELLSSLDDYIIGEYIRQAPYAETIFSRTANTIRLLTILDPDSRSPVIAAAAHRFGTNKSYPVDNFTRGGLSTAIDLESGTLGRSAAHTSGGRITWLDHHPDSGAPIAGVTVPRWNELCDTIRELASYLHYCPLIGWDIVCTENGMKIIEANDSPGVDFLQIHSPLLANEAIRTFFTRNGLLNSLQKRSIMKETG
ncbi:hypothetical protein CR163_008430 [Prosthecochloris sp. ZM_2]|uniref:sugar-transfer associated ATP-grasp domain-containing protein n=1 Tax=Prosthecochloris sp. ZM_2 TaxID=2045206 RepID=UPI000DF7F65C|nr:sugar-transfer associated ATP-grasp domain-containing protein [Prosthecochloris sp. ZM_2]RNA65247.1 hypothetical protein CR163_008430 [Prosthecochloris sp. ZM_2]